MDQNKKITLLVVAMLVVAGFAYWGNKQGWFVRKPANPSKVTTVNGNIQQMPDGKLPPDMPQDIILPKDAKVMSSYTAVAPNGQSQSTLIYQTAELPTVLNKAYFAYFAKNNWAVQASQASVNASTTQALLFDQQALVAVQQGKSLSIKFSQNADGGGQWAVSVNLLTAPKK